MVKKTSPAFFGSIHESKPDFASTSSCGNNPTTSLPSRHIPVQSRKSFDPAEYTQPFLDFISDNPTIFHAVKYFTDKLSDAGYQSLSERELWSDKLKAGGKYYVTRNGSSLVAFSIGKDYKPGNGVGIVAGHVDALTAKLKPVSTLPTKAGYVQLGVAPYARGLNSTWWDRDLGIGGRVVLKDSQGKIDVKLVKLGWPIARVPTLAPHFGAAANGPFNPETQVVPIIGLEKPDGSDTSGSDQSIPAGTFAATQPPRLVRAIAGELGITDYSSIMNWELELFDTQPAQLGGLDKEFIFAGRIDDKLCCFSAFEALISSPDSASSGIVKIAAGFDDEEIGSQLRQGAKGNLLPSVLEKISEATSPSGCFSPSLYSQLLANSFLVSSDVIHAVNPNFLNAYLDNHYPSLNVGLTISADPNGNMTTDSISTSFLRRIADKSDCTLQLFQIRNDSRSGGTIGPMTSSMLGIRAIDAGIPQLSMHSIRATTGSLDPGLGVKIFKGFFDYYSEVDAEFLE